MAAIGKTCRVLGRTGQPLGVMATLRGVVVRGNRFMGDPDKPILQVQTINGRASQECIELPLRPYSSGFGEPFFPANLDVPLPPKPDPERSLPRLEYGQTYEFRGYETGSFAGEPDEAAWDGGMAKQRAGFYFTSEFVVVKGKKVPPEKPAPSSTLGESLKLRMHRLPDGDAPASTIKIMEELENVSEQPLFIERKSRSSELFPKKFREIESHRERTGDTEREITTFVLDDDGSTFEIRGHSGPPHPDLIKPGEKGLGEPFTMRFPEPGRYRLECQWTVLCGNNPKELAECKLRSSLEIIIPQDAKGKSGSRLPRRKTEKLEQKQ